MRRDKTPVFLMLAAVGATMTLAIVLLWFGDAGAEPETSRLARDGHVGTVGAAESGRAVLQGYPPPPSPTLATTPAPTPDANGFYPAPQGIVQEVTTLDESPHADVLVPLQQALTEDIALAADWIPAAGGVPGVSIGPLLSDEVRGKRVSRADASSILQAYDQAGSMPVVQGYFENTATTKGDVVPATLWVLITGWQGQVPFPTLEPSDGDDPYPWQPVPSDVGAEASVWGLCCPGEWRWFMWATGEYYELVNHLSTETNDAVEAPLGTYVVIRP